MQTTDRHTETGNYYFCTLRGHETSRKHENASLRSGSKKSQFPRLPRNLNSFEFTRQFVITGNALIR